MSKAVVPLDEVTDWIVVGSTDWGICTTVIIDCRRQSTVETDSKFQQQHMLPPEMAVLVAGLLSIAERGC
ncbi:MAG: hypothetical protein EXS05_01030 [Planctomycetaceae bacterium]|nr:hypothetical protein [Planctomycetaceae bacterium]